jgi:hypothetical protein
MSKDLDTTYYRFMSEVRAFLSKLLKNPVDAQPSKYLKDRDFTRKKLINELLSRDVLERHEKILDRTNSDEKDAKYVVKFKVHKKDFEKRIHRIYSKYFEKNVNESVFADEEEMKNKILNGPDGETYRKRGGINEEGEGGGIGAAAPVGEAPAGDSGAGSDTDEKADGGRGQFNTSVFPMQRRSIYAGAQGDVVTKNPMLGKTVTAESKKSRRIFVTEEQLERILEEEIGAGGATTTTSVADTHDGMLGTIKPGKQFQGLNGKSNDDFMEPAMERKPGFSVERIGEKKKK